jgi:hypothetical protein
MQVLEVAESPIPRALLRSPRKVRRKRGTLGLLVVGRVLTLPFLIAATLLIGFVVFEPIIAFVLPAQPARILSRWCDARARRGIAYYIEYRFDRSGFIGRDQVMQGEYNAFHAGQIVKAHVVHLGQVGYSALDRSLSDYAHYRMIVWFNAAFATAIGSVFFYAAWLWPWQAYWLARHGKATFGAVVSKSTVFGGRRHAHFMLTYQFKAKGTLRAERIRISPQRFDEADPMDLIIVLFDPKRPRRNMVYDYCDFFVS